MKGIGKEIQALLEEYTDEVIDTVDNLAEESAKETMNELKNTSPSGHRGKYKRGWRVVKERRGIRTVYIVNNKEYRLTHLLNNGHAIVNQYGRYSGKTTGDNHIGKAEKFGIGKFIEKINKNIK